MLTCVWAVRAVMFPMQRQSDGRIAILGAAPTIGSHIEHLSYKLAMQRLTREIRTEFGDFRIPVSLAAPLGSDDPPIDADPAAVVTEPPRGCVGALTGVGRTRPSLAECSSHIVHGILAGASYILSPRGGVLPTASGHGLLSGVFGHGRFSPALVVLQALVMPVLTLADAGMPVLWREVTTGWWQACQKGRGQQHEDYEPFRDDPMAA